MTRIYRWTVFAAALLVGMAVTWVQVRQLLTTEASAPVVLLSDSFDDLTGRVLPEVSDLPDEFALGYGGGEYSIQQVTVNRAQIPAAGLPGWYGDASLSVDVRLLGNPAGQLIAIGCRNYAPRTGYRLTVRPGLGTGEVARADGAGVLVRLASLTSTSSIRRGNAINHLELSCIGDTIAARNNGAETASVRDATYPAGRMWIGVNVQMDSTNLGNARFDNLLVRGLPAPQGHGLLRIVHDLDRAKILDLISV
jgi:hypothetical protein